MKYVAGIFFVLLSFESYFILQIYNENKNLKIYQESSEQLISGMTSLNAKTLSNISTILIKKPELAIQITKEAACGQFASLKKDAAKKSSSNYTKERYLEIKSEFEAICENT